VQIYYKILSIIRRINSQVRIREAKAMMGEEKQRQTPQHVTYLYAVFVTASWQILRFISKISRAWPWSLEKLCNGRPYFVIWTHSACDVLKSVIPEGFYIFSLISGGANFSTRTNWTLRAKIWSMLSVILRQFETHFWLFDTNILIMAIVSPQ